MVCLISMSIELYTNDRQNDLHKTRGATPTGPRHKISVNHQTHFLLLIALANETAKMVKTHGKRSTTLDRYKSAEKHIRKFADEFKLPLEGLKIKATAIEIETLTDAFLAWLHAQQNVAAGSISNLHSAWCHYQDYAPPRKTTAKQFASLCKKAAKKVTEPNAMPSKSYMSKFTAALWVEAEKSPKFISTVLMFELAMEQNIRHSPLLVDNGQF